MSGHHLFLEQKLAGELIITMWCDRQRETNFSSICDRPFYLFISVSSLCNLLSLSSEELLVIARELHVQLILFYSPWCSLHLPSSLPSSLPNVLLFSSTFSPPFPHVDSVYCAWSVPGSSRLPSSPPLLSSPVFSSRPCLCPCPCALYCWIL